MARYRLIDTSTNTVLENITSNDIAQMLGVNKHYVTSCARNNNLIQMRYKVELIEVVKGVAKIPDELWVEWEKVRKPLNLALKKSGKDIQLICLD